MALRESTDPEAQLVEDAIAGDRISLEKIVKQIQSPVYGLALRMLWHPEDAEDATQEILIRVVTRLSSFRRESRFRTWVYSVASNYLKDVKRSRLEQQQYTFTRFAEELDQGLSDASQDTEMPLLLEEVKIGCTLGMLQCLDRAHRIAYIVGEILEMEDGEATAVLDITRSAFRKRLSRARHHISEFMSRKCGLANPQNRCRCRGRVPEAIRLGRIDEQRLLFAGNESRAREFPEVLARIRKLEETRRAAALYRSHPDLMPDRNFAASIAALLNRQDL